MLDFEACIEQTDFSLIRLNKFSFGGTQE